MHSLVDYRAWRTACVLVAALAAPAAGDEIVLEFVAEAEAAVEAEPAAAPAGRVMAAPAAQAEVAEGAEEDGGEARTTLDARAKQFYDQLRPKLASKLNANLHLLRTVANPTKEQQEKILEQTTKVMEDSLADYADRMINGAGNQNMAQAILQGVVFADGRGSAREPWEVVSEAVADSLKQTLSDEQFARYEAEQQARREFHREATAANFVGAVDSQLGLDDEQRAKIHEAILAGWQKGWEGSLRGLLHSPTYMPRLPNKMVVPHLTPGQKQVWHTLQWQGPVIFGDDGFMGHGLLNVPDFEPREPIEVDQPPAEAEE